MSQDNDQLSPDQGEKDNMLPTPRTDAEAFSSGVLGGANLVSLVTADFARQLETELAEAMEESQMAVDQMSKEMHMRIDFQTENTKLRLIISQVAEALGNGSAVSTDSSIDFMADLPREVELVTSQLRAELKQAKGERDATGKHLYHVETKGMQMLATQHAQIGPLKDALQDCCQWIESCKYRPDSHAAKVAAAGRTAIDQIDNETLLERPAPNPGQSAPKAASLEEKALAPKSDLPDWLQGEYSEEKGLYLACEITDKASERFERSGHSHTWNQCWQWACEELGFPPLPDDLPPVLENGVYLGQLMDVNLLGWIYSCGRWKTVEGYCHRGDLNVYCADLSTPTGMEAAWHVLKRIKEWGEGQ